MFSPRVVVVFCFFHFVYCNTETIHPIRLLTILTMSLLTMLLLEKLAESRRISPFQIKYLDLEQDAPNG